MSFVVSWSTPGLQSLCRSKKKKIFVPFRATDRQTALTRTSADSVGKPGTLLGIVPLTGLRETLRIFRP